MNEGLTRVREIPSPGRLVTDHIALELRKLYEGAQFSVIKHYCGYAVKENSVHVPNTEAELLKNGTLVSVPVRSSTATLPT